MNELYEKLILSGGSFDIIFDPEIGTMELQELGITDRLEYNPRNRFAYAQDLDPTSLWQLISKTAENLDIHEGETEVVDKLTEKVYKTQISYEQLAGQEGFWVTLWYDAQLGHLHRQEKVEIYIKQHSEALPEKFEFYDAKKKVWLEKIAEECKKEYEFGIELEQLNDFIKKNDLLWFLEEMLDIGYDLWDLLEDINRKIQA